MRIDSHQHFWTTSRPNDYGFLTPAAGVLYRDYLPRDLEPQLEAAGIDGTVAVQAAPSDAETEWLLDLAESTEMVLGVVGWLEMDTEPDAFRRRLRELRRRRRFCGLRPMLQDLNDDRWILRPRVLSNLKTVAAEGVAFDILVYPRHLPFVCEMLDATPGLRAVVDHLAKPFIRRGEVQPWADWISRVAAHSNVLCKLSGMATEADHQSWRQQDFVPYVTHIAREFGPGRVMFGSDWPVCLQAASYAQVCAILEGALPEDFRPHREAVWGGNAAAFYGLSKRTGRLSGAD